MPVLIRPRRLGWQKPSPGTPIDRGHPLANGLVAAVELGEGGGASVERVTGRLTVAAGSPPWTVTPHGPGVTFNAASSQSVSVALPYAYGYTPQGFTLQAKVNVTLSTQGAYVDYGNYGGNGIAFGIGGSTLDNPGSLLIGLSEGIGWFAGNTLTTGWHDIVLTRNQGGTFQFYVDGAASGIPAGLSSSALVAGDAFSVGGYGLRPSTSTISYARCWFRNLSAAEVQWLYAEPFAFFRSSTARRYSVSAPAVMPPHPNPLLQNAVYRM